VPGPVLGLAPHYCGGCRGEVPGRGAGPTQSGKLRGAASRAPAVRRDLLRVRRCKRPRRGGHPVARHRSGPRAWRCHRPCRRAPVEMDNMHMRSKKGNMHKMGSRRRSSVEGATLQRTVLARDAGRPAI